MIPDCLITVYSVYFFSYNNLLLLCFFTIDSAMAPKRRSDASSSTSQQRGRRFCFTSFPDASNGPPPINTSGNNVRFYVMQNEICPDTQREHWQGYIEVFSAMRFSQIKTILGRDAHLSHARGTSAENIAYCTKEESRKPGTEPLQFGTPVAEGNEEKKKQLDFVIDAINNGATHETLIEEFPRLYMLYKDKITDFITAKKSFTLESERPVYVEVRWGDHGTGKTSSIFKKNGVSSLICAQYDPPLKCFEAKYVYLKRGMKHWFDGYVGQEVLVLDDFYPFTHEHAEILLAILDKFTHRVEQKGTSCVACWRHVILTSNVDPTHWFFDHVTETYSIPSVKRKAVLDRIHRITHFQGESMRLRPENVPEPWTPPSSQRDANRTPVRPPSPSFSETLFGENNNHDLLSDIRNSVAPPSTPNGSLTNDAVHIIVPELLEEEQEEEEPPSIDSSSSSSSARRSRFRELNCRFLRSSDSDTNSSDHDEYYQ